MNTNNNIMTTEELRELLIKEGYIDHPDKEYRDKVQEQLFILAGEIKSIKDEFKELQKVCKYYKEHIDNLNEQVKALLHSKPKEVKPDGNIHPCIVQSFSELDQRIKVLEALQESKDKETLVSLKDKLIQSKIDSEDITETYTQIKRVMSRLGIWPEVKGDQ